MKKLGHIGFVLLVSSFVAILLSQSLAFAQSEDTLQSSRDPRQRKQEFLNEHVYGGQQVSPDAFDRALEQWRQLPKASTRGPQGAQVGAPSAVTGLAGQVWLPFGPSPLLVNNTLANGRVNAIAVNPNNVNEVFQGSAGGGIWRSTNAADPNNPATWTPLFDQQASLGIGEPSAIAIDPTDTNTLYVGTSQEEASGQILNPQIKNISKGILKSTDRGGSWVVLGADCNPSDPAIPACANTAFTLFATYSSPTVGFHAGVDVNSIIVDPANPSTLYLAASSGLYRSTNGGQSWIQGVNGDAESLVLDTTSPANSRILFAGVNGQGIFRSSTDPMGNQTWTQVLTPAQILGPGGVIGRVMLALAPPASPPVAAGIQVVYATIEAPTGVATPLIYETTNQGGMWTQQTATGLGTCFCFFGMVIGVDPASPGDGKGDILYWGGINYQRSSDSGKNFSTITNGLHPDAHAWAFGKNSAGNTVVFSANDGGIWRSDNNGLDWTGSGIVRPAPAPPPPPTINAGGLQTTLFYHMDVQGDPNANITMGALQDNGLSQTCITQPTGSKCTSPPTWTDTSFPPPPGTGNDGIDIAFDVFNPAPGAANNVFGIWNGGNPEDIFQSTNDGDSFNAIGQAQGIPAAELIAFNNQVSVDPNNGGFLYVSGSATTIPPLAGRLFQNKNAGAFTPIANFGVGNQPGEVDVAPANSNNVAVAVGNSVFVSTNALSAAPTFTNMASATRQLPARNVTEVAFDPNDPTVIYAVLSGFNNQTPGAPGHIFRTTIAGTAWTDISPKLDPPLNTLDVPFLTIALDGTSTPTTIYAGTALGVLRSVDGGKNWTTLDDIHLPNVPVTELKINSQAGVLRASTFGRGVFNFAPATGPVISVNAQNGLNFGTVCPGSTANLTLQVFNVGTQNLVVNSVQNLSGSADFSVLPNPSTPVTIGPNEEVDFTVQFKAQDSTQIQKAVIRVSSNDPGAPFFDLTATGTSSPPAIATVIADSGNFGNACVGSFVDLPLTISNSGGCTLSVTGITSSSPEFGTANVVSFPLTIGAGGSLQVPIRFAPTIFGSQSGQISVSSNDPANAKVSVAVSGNAPRPRETNTSCKFIAINSGGSAVSPFLSDQDFSGGSTSSTSSSINTSGVILPAPQRVYQSIRFGSSGSTFTYTIPGFTPGSNHAVRLHLAETFFSSPGQRRFNAFINGMQVLFNFDIVVAAGGARKAIIEEFPATADGSGRIVIRFTKGTANNPLINGIEIE
jgi:hypothetical protein